MRILTISNCPLDPTQGSGHVILGFVNGLRALGWKIDAFGPDDIAIFPRINKARSWRIAFGMLRHALHCVRRANYDIVEFYGGEAWMAIQALVRRPDRRFLVVSHSNGLEPFCSEQLIRHLGTNTFDGRPRRWYQYDPHTLMARAFTRADALVTVSNNDRDYALRNAYQPTHRLLVVENALADVFLGQTVCFERAPRIVFCGSWTARKGARLIVEAMTSVLRRFPASRLRLIGVGKGFRPEAYFSADICERVEVFPFIADKADLRAAYLECAIAIAPSAYESFGLSAAEAMACGCALVASRTGFAASLKDRVEACLLVELSASTLCEQIQNLLLDETRRKAIASAGHGRVQCLRPTDAVQRLATSYQRWATERSSAGLGQK
jgi:glycosyltransferase involved in cell wall biosynthesis